ncbi:MAG: type III-B CRISPR module RAMP protein Cmr6 [Acetobacteraceae bacterium]
MSNAFLMPRVAQLVDIARKVKCHHPGLTLDKHSFAAKQEMQKVALAPVCDACGDEKLLRALAARREAILEAAGSKIWSATTAGPLTLHLSRANAFENAGIALHPLYGFACLPGSGLKGLARAYAETIWLPAQPDPIAACQDIVDVFGCAPESDKDKPWLPESRRQAKDSSAGAVVFHDAWPEAWPKLFIDIAAVHHQEYYQAPENAVPPPGDWEGPQLISFLAIKPGTEFRFALTLRRGRTADGRLLAQAQEWLAAALATLGAGAKTAAGYGLFRSATAAKPAASPSRAEALFDLTLVTPAFLAGGAQEKEDCDLRGATLRGQLRWWWRAMHAAHLEPAILRRLEASIWGASSAGSAVRLSLEPGSNPEPCRFEYNRERDGAFLQANGIQRTALQAPAIDGRKTTQGLFYAAYGAGKEISAGREKPGRWLLQPGSTWRLKLGARPSKCPPGDNVARVEIKAETVLRQATAALFLLTRFGGVGAKARKGFGSFDDTPIDGIASIDDCKRAARELRSLCGLGAAAYRDAPSLELMSAPVLVQTKWTNAWFALNRIGEAMQAYAKTGKHQAWKSALGLPRKSDCAEADNKELRPKASIPHFREELKGGRLGRHAAPIHYHVARSEGTLELRLVAFTSPHLPDEATSKERLDALRAHVAPLLRNWANAGGTSPFFPKPAVRAPKPVAPVATHSGGGPIIGGRIRAELLAEKTKGGGWKAKDLVSGQIRSIQNTARVPADRKPGDKVELEVPNSSEWKYPVPPPPAPPPPRRPGGRR